MTQIIQKGFKQTEIGIIPEDWEIIELGKIADSFNNKRKPLSSMVRAKRKGSFPYYGANGPIDYIDDFLFDGEYLLIGEDGSVIKDNGTAYSVIVNGKFWCSNHAHVLKANSLIGNSIRFLKYLFDYKNIIPYVTGAVQPKLNKGNLESILFPLPPLLQQQRIVEILSSTDDKIELLEKQNKTLENIGQAIFKSWFVDFEGFENDLVESEMGMIPRGWKVGIMGDIISTIESGKRPKGGIDSNLINGIPSIGAENIIGLGNFNYSKNKLITREFFNTIKMGIIQSYDVLLYKDGANLGRSSMFGKGFPYKECCINEHVFILRSNEKINQFYLYYWTTLAENKQAIINLNSNAAQPGINQVSVKSLKIIIPNIDIVKKYESLMKDNVDKIFKNCLQIQALSNLRDSLLPRLMNGKVKI